MLCLICALNSIIGNAILFPVPCKKAGLGLGWLLLFFSKTLNNKKRPLGLMSAQSRLRIQIKTNMDKN